MSSDSDPKKKKVFALGAKIWRYTRLPLYILLGIIVVLLVFILAGGLGPTVKYVGVPIARSCGIPLSIEKCVILPLGGYVRIEGLQVDNPRSFVDDDPDVYSKTPLARIGKFEADVAMLSLFSEELRVETIQLTGVRALYAFDLDTTNVDALLLQMGVDPSAEAPVEEPAAEEVPVEEPAAEPAEPAEMPRFRIAYINLEDNSVTVRKFVSLPLPLPPLTLRDVDNETLVEKFNSMIQPLVKTVGTVSSGLGSGLDSGMKLLGDGASAVTEGAAGLGSGTLDLSKDALDSGAKALEDGAKAIGDGLKSLFGD